MRTFEMRVTQEIHGYYEGTIEIEAKSKKESLKRIKSMTKDEMDDQADWTHGEQYDGDKESIEIDE